MLTELSIEDLALFQRASVAFGPGLNVVTGETGAGKSLLIDALELLLGERPRASMVRTGADEARVEGRFALARATADARELREFLASNLPDVLLEWRAQDPDLDRELILGRALGANGRTRAWVNHRPVTQRLLRDLAGLLVEVHGQNEHQRLFDASEQGRLLDGFADLDAAREAYRESRARWVVLVDEAEAHGRAARDRAERLDLLAFQARELSEARVSVEEHDELERERERLRHANELAVDLGRALSDLAGEDGAALDAVKRAARAVEHWRARVRELDPIAQDLQAASAHLAEAAAGLESFLPRLEPSPERLEEVEQRLYRLETLRKKYRTDVAGLVARLRDVEQQLRAHASGDAEAERLFARRSAALAEVEARASDLTKKRRAALPKLRRAVQSSLSELGLERATFEARLTPRGSAADGHAASPNADPEKRAQADDARRFGPDGADAIEFFLAANPGEEAQPLRRVASGGEAARILLALRTALALRQTIPTLVFDEVDAGVGGRLGPKVGEHLRALGARHQILCVTHLPAIAALAERHLRVSKHLTGGRTITRVEALSGEARVEEVADMIAGGAAHASARAEARRLLAPKTQIGPPSREDRLQGK